MCDVISPRFGGASRGPSLQTCPCDDATSVLHTASAPARGAHCSAERQSGCFRGAPPNAVPSTAGDAVGRVPEATEQLPRRRRTGCGVRQHKCVTRGATGCHFPEGDRPAPHGAPQRTTRGRPRSLVTCYDASRHATRVGTRAGPRRTAGRVRATRAGPAPLRCGTPALPFPRWRARL